MRQLARGQESINLSGVLLYLEDFFQILGLFKEHCDVVEVFADGFALDNPEVEIPQLKSRLNRSEVFDLMVEGSQFYPLDAHTESPARGLEAMDPKEANELHRRKKYPPLASLTLHGDYQSLAYDADDPKAKGLSIWIRDRLRYRTLARILGEHPLLPGSLFAIALLACFGITWMAARLPLPVILKVSLSATGLLLQLCLIVWGVSRIGPRKSVAVLRLENRSQRASFLVRYKDQLVLIVVTAFITAIITTFITLAAGRLSQFFKSP